MLTNIDKYLISKSTNSLSVCEYAHVHMCARVRVGLNSGFCMKSDDEMLTIWSHYILL